MSIGQISGGIFAGLSANGALNGRLSAWIPLKPAVAKTMTIFRRHGANDVAKRRQATGESARFSGISRYWLLAAVVRPIG